MAYYSTHSISQFLWNNEKQRVRFLLAHPVHTVKWNSVYIPYCRHICSPYIYCWCNTACYV